MLKKIINHELWGERLADALASYIRFVRRTNTTITEPENPDIIFRQHTPFILGVWHGQFLLIPTIRPHDIEAKIVVGVHGDAELAAKIVSRFGVTPIRGSGAAGRRTLRDRGGAKVLKQAIKALAENYCIVSTADVPPGPAQRAGEGIITMARLSGRPIVPAAITTKRTITFKSWSRLTINLPYNKTGFVVGDPIYIPRDCTLEELEQHRQTLEQAMRRVTIRAHELVGRTTKKIDPHWEHSLNPGLSLKTYRFLTTLARPLAPLIIKYRANRGKEIIERADERYGITDAKRPKGKLWWFHAASIGETNACLPIIKKLLAAHEDLSILLTTGTVTSAKLAAELLPARATHQFIPLDNTLFVKRFLAHWRPNMGLLIESEIWPNLILSASARKIPLLLINGRMSKRSFKRWFKKPAMSRPLFGRFNKILAQGPLDARRFIQLGAENVINTGNIKIDAPAPPFDPAILEALKSAIGDRPLMVAASTHPGEEEIIAQAHNIIALDYPDFLTIIVPRHPHRGEAIIRELETIYSPTSSTTVTTGALTGPNFQLRSKSPTPNRDTNIYIADTLGELGLFYSLSKIAFIGGSLIRHGGQNPIEAVKLGANILTGPHIDNFGESYFELFQRGGAIKITDAKSLAAKIIDLLQNPDQHAKMDEGAKASLEYLSGGEQRTLDFLENYFTQNS